MAHIFCVSARLAPRASRATPIAPVAASLRRPLPLQSRQFKHGNLIPSWRQYSTEAAEAAAAQPEPAGAEEPPAQGSDPITQFEQLAQIGVQSAVVQAITRDLGFLTMTDVQAATIPVALTGPDVYA